MKLEPLKKTWGKYKYVFAILLIGLVFLLLPGKSDRETAQAQLSDRVALPVEDDAEQRLEEILHKIKGVGEVHVVLSYKTSEEHCYTKDAGETVLVNCGSGKQEPLEKKIVSPTYLGAIVVCQGADNASVQAYVYDAVEQFTGLRTDQISVLPLQYS